MIITRVYSSREFISLAFIALSVAVVGGSSAAALTFTVDDSLSSLNLKGTVDLGAGPVSFEEQSPGSASAVYGGTIQVAADDFAAPTTIAISSASLVAGIFPGGPLLPATDGGPAAGDAGTPSPANYGIQLNAGLFGFAYAAARGVEWDLSAPAETVVDGKFSSLAQTLAATAGTFDVNLPAAFGTDPASDPLGTVIVNTAGESSYSVDGNTAVLMLPFMAVDPGGLTVEYSGTIVATAIIPEPTTCLLFGLGIAALTGWRRRT